MITDVETLNRITERIIGCAYKVANKLGCGFFEHCYENALAYELGKAGLSVARQVRLQVWYDDIVVGEYIADLIVEGSVLVELKAIQSLDAVHSAQCINYLAATKLPLCLLINFGKRVDIKRIVGPTLGTLPSPPALAISDPLDADSLPPSSVSTCAPSVANPPLQ
jgi:GxxExxY protein